MRGAATAPSRGGRSRTSRSATVFVPLAIVLVLVGAWELYARVGGVEDLILPAPTDVGRSLWTDRSLLWDNFVVTAQEVLFGLGLAVAAGALLAAALHASAAVRRAVYPLLVASQTVPIVIVAPLLVVWFGYGLAPKLAIIALICFFPVVVTALDGLASVDPELRKLMHTLDAPRLRTFRLVEVPAALPSLFSGARIAVAVAVIGAVLAEQAGSSDGLGHLLLQATPQLETARAYAAVVVLSAFAIALFALLAVVERLALPWAHRTRAQGARP